MLSGNVLLLRFEGDHLREVRLDEGLLLRVVHGEAPRDVGVHGALDVRGDVAVANGLQFVRSAREQVHELVPAAKG